MQATKIQWTDFTSNPIKFKTKDGKPVWACIKVSPGCKFCYAESNAKRYDRGGPFSVSEMDALSCHLDEKELNALLKSTKISGKMVFIGDMTDIFGQWVPFALLDKLFTVFALRPDVIFQVLTKRPKRAREYFESMTAERGIDACQFAMATLKREPTPEEYARIRKIETGLPNVWFGTSAEDQERADERLPDLLEIPAAVRFVSAEPLLGPVNLRGRLLDISIDDPGRCGSCGKGHGFSRCPNYGRIEKLRHDRTTDCYEFRRVNFGIHWVIVGGENGPRACDVDWIRSLVKQCDDASVPVFVKQLGSYPMEDGEMLPAQSRQCGDPAFWPEDIRFRQFPAGATNAHAM